MDKKQQLLDLLNATVKVLKPFKFTDFNQSVDGLSNELLLELESKNPLLGIGGTKECYKVSAASLMATITDVLCGERLAFQVDEETGQVVGFQWYVNPALAEKEEVKG